ncbi:MAG: lipoprotein insertase outer membrane protein LolB [Fulvimonas sp.]|jgi:outer membrane lipoprotein LolB|nr:lipoprotein insertase outer membrane protein LolB [Fulvimonas sp.]
MNKAGWAIVLAVFLAGCVPAVRMRGSPEDLAAQRARERQLAGVERWQVRGRLGVYDARGGGSGDFSWRQDGTRYEFTLHGPSLSGVDLRLRGDEHGALLEGDKRGPLRGRGAEALMQQALGWVVPLDELRAWLFGLRAPGGGPAELEFGADHLPARLRQDGWTVDYRAWDTDRQPPLPRKLFAEKPPYKVRLAIDAFELDAAPTSTTAGR